MLPCNRPLLSLCAVLQATSIPYMPWKPISWSSRLCSGQPCCKARDTERGVPKTFSMTQSDSQNYQPSRWDGSSLFLNGFPTRFSQSSNINREGQEGQSQLCLIRDPHVQEDQSQLCLTRDPHVQEGQSQLCLTRDPHVTCNLHRFKFQVKVDLEIYLSFCFVFTQKHTAYVFTVIATHERNFAQSNIVNVRKDQLGGETSSCKKCEDI